MAENKKSFVLYSDLIHVVRKLVKQDRENDTNYSGELFLHILEYVNDTQPIAIDFIVEMAFEPIKQQLKRDLIKYEDKKIQWSEAGKASAEKRALKKLNGNVNSPTVSTSVDSVPTVSTVNDNVNDNVNDVDESTNTPTPTNLKFFYAIGEIKEFMLSDENSYWLETYCMQNKASPEQIKICIDEFLVNLKDNNILQKNKKDLFIHFNNWYKKQKQNGREKQQQEKQVYD